jgi:RHS repeat-associated protein
MRTTVARVILNSGQGKSEAHSFERLDDAIEYTFTDANGQSVSGGNVPVTTNALGSWTNYAIPDQTFSQTGTLTITLKSYDQTTVYFDDLTVEQTVGTVLQENHYYQGQFANEDSASGYHSFQLRLYAAKYGRWLSCDPKQQHNSPYLAMGNNPVSKVDADGGEDSPVVDTNGNLLGTDSEGWQGETIVMNQKDFKQGMKHSAALKKGTELSKYGKGIRIKENAWSTIEANGGKRMTPTIINNSNKSIYYKQEYSDNAYWMGPNLDLYAQADGFASTERPGYVFKFADGQQATIGANGDISTITLIGLKMPFSYVAQKLDGGLIKGLPTYFEPRAPGIRPAFDWNKLLSKSYPK